MNVCKLQGHNALPQLTEICNINPLLFISVKCQLDKFCLMFRASSHEELS